MVKSSVRNIILVSVLVMMFSLVSSVVLATDSPIQIPSANTTTEVPANNTTVEANNTTVPNTTTTLVTNRTNDTSLPATGEASDYVVMALIVVATVSAVYAYGKTKKYNV